MSEILNLNFYLHWQREMGAGNLWLAVFEDTFDSKLETDEYALKYDINFSKI